MKCDFVPVSLSWPIFLRLRDFCLLVLDTLMLLEITMHMEFY